MLNKILFILLTIGLFSCKNTPEKDLGSFKSDFIQSYSTLFPDETPLSKENAKLSELHIPNTATIDSVKIFYTRFSTEIKDFNTQKWTETDKKDLSKISGILKNINSYTTQYQTNPTIYNVHYAFNRILNSNFDTPENRLQIIFNKLDKVPPFYEAAKSQLQKASVQQADETIERHLETYRFFDEILPNYLAANHFITPQYQERLELAKLAIKDYVAYVESLRLQ